MGGDKSDSGSIQRSIARSVLSGVKDAFGYASYDESNVDVSQIESPPPSQYNR